MCVYIYIYICMYMYMYMYVCIYIYIYIHIHMCTYVFVYSPVQQIFIQMPSQDNKPPPKSSSKTWRSSWRDSTTRRHLAICAHNRSVIKSPREETQLTTLPCARSVYPNAFSRQQANPKVIIQDVAEKRSDLLQIRLTTQRNSR